jgi:hypothetical protein
LSAKNFRLSRELFSSSPRSMLVTVNFGLKVLTAANAAEPRGGTWGKGVRFLTAPVAVSSKQNVPGSAAADTPAEGILIFGSWRVRHLWNSLSNIHCNCCKSSDLTQLVRSSQWDLTATQPVSGPFPSSLSLALMLPIPIRKFLFFFCFSRNEKLIQFELKKGDRWSRGRGLQDRRWSKERREQGRRVKGTRDNECYEPGRCSVKVTRRAIHILQGTPE